MDEGTSHRLRMVFELHKSCFETVSDVSRDVCPEKRPEDYDVKTELHDDCNLARAQFRIDVDAGHSLWRFDRVSVKMNKGNKAGNFLYGWRLMVMDNKTMSLTPAFRPKVPIRKTGTADVTRKTVTSDTTVEKGVRTEWADDYHGSLGNQTSCDEARPDMMSETKRWNVASVFGTPLLKHLVERDFRVDIDDFLNVDRDRRAILMPKKHENVDEYVRYLKDKGCGRDEVRAARFEAAVQDALRTCGRSLMNMCKSRDSDRDTFRSVKTNYTIPFPVVESLVAVVQRLHSESNYVKMQGKSLVLELDRFFDNDDDVPGSIELEMSYVSDVLLPQNFPWSVDQLIETDRLQISKTVADVFAGAGDSGEDEDVDDGESPNPAPPLNPSSSSSSRTNRDASRDTDHGAKRDKDEHRHRYVHSDRERFHKSRRFVDS